MTFVLAVSVTGIQISDVSGDVVFSKLAEAATAMENVNIVAYTRYSGNLNTYSDAGLTKRIGYICANDQCTILDVYNNGAVRVRYPVKKGTRTAYAAMSGFFINTDFSTNTMKLGTGKTAYRKSTGNATIGSVFKDDNVMIVGHENGRTELIYPTSSGYKIGWVAGTYDISTQDVKIADGVYTVVSALDNNYALDILQSSLEDLANCQLHQSNGTDAQKFQISLETDGYYTIKNIRSGKVLDCAYSGTQDETNVWQCGANGTAAQRWKFLDAGNGYYTILCKCNNLALDVYYSGVYNGNNIQVHHTNGTNAQRWKLIPVSQTSAVSTWNLSGSLLTVKGVSLNEYQVGSKYTTSRYANVNGKQVDMQGWQCCGYARYVLSKLFGCHDKNAGNKFRDVSGKISGNNLTADRMKSVVQDAGVGAHIRTNKSEHSLVIIGITEDGFTITDANSDGKYTVRVKTFTWSEYISTYGKRGLLYVKKYVG